MLRTLTQKVALVALIGLGLFLIVATLAIANIIIIRNAANHVTEITLKQVELSGEFNTDLFRSFAEALSFARTHDSANRESALQEIFDASALLNQLGTVEMMPDSYAPDLALAHAQLQDRRVAVFATYSPAILELVRAVDANDERASAAALDSLNQRKNDIEQLEEDSGILADRSIDVAGRTIAASTQNALVSAGISFGVFVLLILLTLFLVRQRIIQPINSLATAANAVGAGRLDQVVAVSTSDEIGVLQGAFNQMVAHLAAARAAVAEQQRTLESRVAERTADLTQALGELREANTAREQLNATVQELSSPVVPVLDGILVMPLIGVIDTERASILIQTLLAAIEQHHANVVIVDVTGVPIVDTQVAQTLLQAARASKLLGAQTLLVGLRPELAQTIVGLGIDLVDLLTRADLQSGIHYAIQYHGGRARTHRLLDRV